MGSARGAPTAQGGLNSAMLASLNKEANRSTRKPGLPLPGRVVKKEKVGLASDNIENSLDLRASRGELPKKAHFELSNEEMVNIANGKSPEEEKVSGSAALLDKNKQKLPPKAMPPKKAVAKTAEADSDNKNFGKVPKYLQKYNEEAKQK